MFSRKGDAQLVCVLLRLICVPALLILSQVTMVLALYSVLGIIGQEEPHRTRCKLGVHLLALFVRILERWGLSATTPPPQSADAMQPIIPRDAHHVLK